MKKEKVFVIFITIIVSIIFLVVITNLVTTNYNINQGKFRVSDVILTSTAEFTDKISENEKWSFDISQKNLLSILISATDKTDIKHIYLSDIRIIGKKPLIISQLNSEIKKTVGTDKESLELEWTVSDKNQVLIEIEFLNEKLLENWTVPEGLNEIRKDGTIFKLAEVPESVLKTTVEFKLNIEENIGKVNTMKVNLKIPNDELINNGHDIRKLELSNFVFRTK